MLNVRSELLVRAAPPLTVLHSSPSHQTGSWLGRGVRPDLAPAAPPKRELAAAKTSRKLASGRGGVGRALAAMASTSTATQEKKVRG